VSRTRNGVRWSFGSRILSEQCGTGCAFVQITYSNSIVPVSGVGWSTPFRRAYQGCKKGAALAVKFQ
jgi:hypothetical protein